MDTFRIRPGFVKFLSPGGVYLKLRRPTEDGAQAPITPKQRMPGQPAPWLYDMSPARAMLLLPRNAGAAVAKLAYAAGLKSAGVFPVVGSSPTSRTKSSDPSQVICRADARNLLQ